MFGFIQMSTLSLKFLDLCLKFFNAIRCKPTRKPLGGRQLGRPWYQRNKGGCPKRWVWDSPLAEKPRRDKPPGTLTSIKRRNAPESPAMPLLMQLRPRRQFPRVHSPSHCPHPGVAHADPTRGGPIVNSCHPGRANRQLFPSLRGRILCKFDDSQRFPLHRPDGTPSGGSKVPLPGTINALGGYKINLLWLESSVFAQKNRSTVVQK